MGEVRDRQVGFIYHFCPLGPFMLKLLAGGNGRPVLWAVVTTEAYLRMLVGRQFGWLWRRDEAARK